MFTDGEVERLAAGDAVVRDGALTPDEVAAMRAAVLRAPLRAAGVGRDAKVERRVRHDDIAWLERGEDPAFEPAFVLFDQLRAAAREELWLGVTSYEVHAARYPPGGGYDAHRDTLRGDAARRFTVVLYLNPAWAPGDGGELLTWPEGGPPGVVAPVAGRLVGFLSHRLLHAVAPARVERLSVTGWLRA